MLTRWQFWVLTLLALASAALIGANMWRFAANRQLQAEVTQRAQFIQQTVPLEALNREIVAALAQLAVRSKDDQLRALLTSLGLTVTETPATPAPAAPATAAGKK
jgi:type VI protein secretion system component VasK